MSNRIYKLDNPADVEELNRLVFEEGECDTNTLPQEDFDESDESSTEDYLETRSMNSDTDHEIDDVDTEDMVGAESENFDNGRDGTKEALGNNSNSSA
ncbi:uncharacterized protein [Diabrotica undecimpunctata]|uniref:uncharacterized protein n=1 Tax=Diabrotica undecimpunctata TaxID=50387 RepID=UPI003B642B1C